MGKYVILGVLILAAILLGLDNAGLLPKSQKQINEEAREGEVPPPVVSDSSKAAPPKSEDKPAVSLAVAPPIMESEIASLVVITRPDGSLTGAVLPLTATAVLANDHRNFGIKYREGTPRYMGGSARGLESLLREKHADSQPSGHRILIDFPDLPGMKDGVSTSLASGLMVHEMITGIRLDHTFAATGDLSPAGEVDPVSGVDFQLRAVETKQFKFLAVPIGNEEAVNDLYITKGLKLVTELQIIGVRKIDELLALGALKKSDKIRSAFEEYDSVKEVILRNPRNASHPAVRKKIEEILEVIPGHLSAKLILLHGQKKAPKKLSMAASLYAIENSSLELMKLLKKSETTPALARRTSKRLSSMGRIVNAGAQPCLQSHIALASFIAEAGDLSEKESEKLEALRMKTMVELKKISDHKKTHDHFLNR